MKKLLHGLIIALLILLAVVCFSCWKPELNMAVYSTFSDPMVIWDPSDTLSDEVIVLQNMYETLLRYNFQERRYEKILAESYEKSEDGLTWTFKLRKDVKFHTGGVLDASMVKASIERMLERGMGALEIWDCLESITVMDPLTVRFNLIFAENFERIVSSAYGAYIFDTEAVEVNGDSWFTEGNDAGSGPYTVERWTQDAELILKAFPEYWGGWSEQQFKTVVFKTAPEATTRILQLEAGEADIAAMLLPEQLAALRENPDIVVDDSRKFQNLSLLFNTKKTPLDNPLIRRAIALAIPYERIINRIMLGNAYLSHGYIPAGVWGYADDMPAFTNDIDEAKRLLLQTGVKNLSLTITYVSGDEVERQVAETMKSNLAMIGIDLKIQAMTWDSQWALAQAEKPSARQDLFLTYYWASYADPYNFLSMGYKTEEQINLNLSYYSNGTFDNLIEKARSIAGADTEQAQALYQQAQAVLLRDIPGIALFDMAGDSGFRNSLKGHIPNPYYTGVVFFYNTWRE